jgi:hypothetical protein
MKGHRAHPHYSSTVASIQYDHVARELTVDFHRSGRYIYRDVPPDVAQAFTLSSSKGQYLERYIKGRYAYSKD